jgi:hypothetical protein
LVAQICHQSPEIRQELTLDQSHSMHDSLLQLMSPAFDTLAVPK